MSTFGGGFGSSECLYLDSARNSDKTADIQYVLAYFTCCLRPHNGAQIGSRLLYDSFHEWLATVPWYTRNIAEFNDVVLADAFQKMGLKTKRISSGKVWLDYVIVESSLEFVTDAKLREMEVSSYEETIYISGINEFNLYDYITEDHFFNLRITCNASTYVYYNIGDNKTSRHLVNDAIIFPCLHWLRNKNSHSLAIKFKFALLNNTPVKITYSIPSKKLDKLLVSTQKTPEISWEVFDWYTNVHIAESPVITPSEYPSIASVLIQQTEAYALNGKVLVGINTPDINVVIGHMLQGHKKQDAWGDFIITPVNKTDKAISYSRVHSSGCYENIYKIKAPNDAFGGLTVNVIIKTTPPLSFRDVSIFHNNEPLIFTESAQGMTFKSAFTGGEFTVKHLSSIIETSAIELQYQTMMLFGFEQSKNTIFKFERLSMPVLDSFDFGSVYGNVLIVNDTSHLAQDILSVKECNIVESPIITDKLIWDFQFLFKSDDYRFLSDRELFVTSLMYFTSGHEFHVAMCQLKNNECLVLGTHHQRWILRDRNLEYIVKHNDVPLFKVVWQLAGIAVFDISDGKNILKLDQLPNIKPLIASTKRSQYILLHANTTDNDYIFIGETIFSFKTDWSIEKFEVTPKYTTCDTSHDFYATTKDSYYYFGTIKSVLPIEDADVEPIALYRDVDMKVRQHQPQYSIIYL
jgi:hypothetical protein